MDTGDKEHLPYKLAVLRDRGSDLTKEWYIEYYVFSDITQKLERQRSIIPLSHKSERQRRKYAKDELLKSIKC